MAEDAALIYCHLAPSAHSLPQVKLKDPARHEHELTLSQFPFVLQRKATSVEAHLQSMGNKAEAEDALKSIFDLMVKRYQKGYSDKDPHPITNFGFIGRHAVYVDVSGIAKGRENLHEYFVYHELSMAEKKAVTWLKDEYPELVDVTYQKIHEIKSELR